MADEILQAQILPIDIEAEKNFAARRFTSASDAFDTVKAYIIERAAQLENDPLNKGDNGRTDG